MCSPFSHFSFARLTCNCVCLSFDGSHEETCFRGIRTTNEQNSLQSDQRFSNSLIRSIISINLFWLVSVDEQADLVMTWSDTPKTDFLMSRPICEWKIDYLIFFVFLLAALSPQAFLSE